MILSRLYIYQYRISGKVEIIIGESDRSMLVIDYNLRPLKYQFFRYKNWSNEEKTEGKFTNIWDEDESVNLRIYSIQI